MAVLRAVVVAVVTISTLLQVAMATSYTVGSPQGGWDLGTNLKTWTSTKKFHPGDILNFTYTPSHDVTEVTKSDYDSCTATAPIQAFTSGNTVISLKAAGKRYFICGVPGHCAAGMKLEVDISAAATSPPAPKSPSLEAPSPSSVSPTVPPSIAPALSPPSGISTAPSSGIGKPAAPAPAPSSATHSGRQLAEVAAGLGVGILAVLSL